MAIRLVSYPFAWFRYAPSGLLNRRSLIPLPARPAALKLIPMGVVLREPPLVLAEFGMMELELWQVRLH